MEDGEYEESQEIDSGRRSYSAASILAKMNSGFREASTAVSDAFESANDNLKKLVRRVDHWAESNRIGRKFAFKQRRTKLSVELRSGTITFLMVAYVLAVNPDILEMSGGTCDAKVLCTPELYDLLGDSCLFNANNKAAIDCLQTLKMDLTTATAASALIACFIMGFFANLPLALAPGMGINIYLAYQVVGQGLLTYQQAMVAIFLEGFIFIFLSMTGVRAGIIRFMPENISRAASVGIGLLLAFTGLRNLGIIVFDSNTLLTLGGCPESHRQYVFVASNPSTTGSPSTTGPQNLSSVIDSDGIQQGAYDVYSCDGQSMLSATMWLGIAGGAIMALLTSWRVKGALFMGIAFVTIVSWIPGHAASYLGATSPIPGGEYRMDVFSQVVAAPSISSTGLAWDWSAVGTGHFWVVLLTFLYIDLLDCTGILLAMAGLLDECLENDAKEGGSLEVYDKFLNDKKEFQGQQWAFLSDGLGIVAGSMMGVSPLTVYMESAAGIEDGGRTGVVAIVVSFFFFISLFFSPIFSSIPPYATGPALVLIGVMLIAHVDTIPWDDPLESVPAFLTIIMMPFTLSVAYGLIAGLMAYVMLHIPMWSRVYSQLAWEKYKEKYRPPTEEEDFRPPAPSSSQSGRNLRHRAVRKHFGGGMPSEDGSYQGHHGINGGVHNSSPIGIRRSTSNGSLSFMDYSRHSYASGQGMINYPGGPGGGGSGYNSMNNSFGPGQSPLTAPPGQLAPAPRGAGSDYGAGSRGFNRAKSMGAAHQMQRTDRGGGGGGGAPIMSMARSRTFADMSTAALEATTLHDLAAGGGGNMPRPHSAGDNAQGDGGEDTGGFQTFKLFGDLLPLNLDLDTDDEAGGGDDGNNKATEHSLVEETELQSGEIPGSSKSALAASAPESISLAAPDNADNAAAAASLDTAAPLPSVEFSTGTGSPDEVGYERGKTADLSMFRKSSSVFPNPLLESSSMEMGSGTVGGDGSAGTNTGTSRDVDLSASISLGSSSLNKVIAAEVAAQYKKSEEERKEKEAAAALEAAAVLALGGEGEPLVRIEGWPTGDGSVSEIIPHSAPMAVPGTRAPLPPVRVSSSTKPTGIQPAPATLPESQSGGEAPSGNSSISGVPSSSAPTLRRIESAAATRLRSLFSSDDDLASAGDPSASASASASATDPPSLPTSVPSFTMGNPLSSSPFDQELGGEWGTVLSPRAEMAAQRINLPETIISGAVLDVDLEEYNKARTFKR